MFGKKLKQQKISGTTSMQQVLENTISPEQFSMPIKKVRFQWLVNFKRKLVKIELEAEMTPYWKNFLSVFSVLSTFVLFGIIFSLFITNFDKLPDKMPFVYIQNSKSWALVEKELIITVSLIMFAVSAVVYRFNFSAYYFDKRLATMINACMIVFNFFALVAFLEIFSLVLIY